MSDWPDIVEGVFPSGEMHMISGSRGAGKTGFEVGMEKAVMAGEPFLGRQTWRPPFWGVLIYDRAPTDRIGWWKAAEMEPLPYYSLTADPKMSPMVLLKQTPEQSLEMLHRHIEDMDPPAGGVITIDVANFFAGDGNMSYRSGFAHGWAIGKIARDRDITIFCLMHGGKQKGGQQYIRLTDRTIAGTGFMGGGNAFAYIATREETQLLADSTVMDLNRPDAQVFEWEPRKGGTERFVFGRAASGLFICLSDGRMLPKKDIGPAQQKRLHDIADCLRPVDEIDGVSLRTRLGMTPATFSRDVNILVLSGKVKEAKKGRTMFYSLLPEGAPS